jgi:hypothetical protein
MTPKWLHLPAELKLRAERKLGDLLQEMVIQGSHNKVLPDGVTAMQRCSHQ